MSRGTASTGTRACTGFLLLLGALAACGDGATEDPADFLVGTWQVDKEHYRAVLMDDLRARRPTNEHFDAPFIDGQIAELHVELVLAAEGTWKLAGSLGSLLPPLDAEGTWKAEGERLTLRFTREQGRAIVKTVTGRIDAGGSLLVRPSPGQPGAFRMIRRP